MTGRWSATGDGLTTSKLAGWRTTMPGPDAGIPDGIPEHIRVEMENEDAQEQVERLERRVRELSQEVTSREQEVIRDLRAQLQAAERVVEAAQRSVTANAGIDPCEPVGGPSWDEATEAHDQLREAVNDYRRQYLEGDDDEGD